MFPHWSDLAMNHTGSQPCQNTTQGPVNAVARPGRNKGSRRHLSSGPFPAKTVARLPPVPQRRIEQILRDGKAQSHEGRKKKRGPNRIDLFYISLWCAKKEGRRELTEKKEQRTKGEVKIGGIFALIPLERPRHEPYGGSALPKHHTGPCKCNS